MESAAVLPQKILGKYALYQVIASGGMARVHLGRLRGPAGFSRTVAIKRLHPQYAAEPEFVAMLLDEARLSARLRHPNVVPTLDILAEENEVFLVMEYVRGVPLAQLLRASPDKPPSPRYVAHIVTGVLNGLHSAHEAVNGQGQPLGLVHRDISPQNVLVSVEGVSQVIDFGIAKAIGRLHTTRDGALKGKMSYMAPEQLRGDAIDRRVDVYATAVVLWEALTGRRLFKGDNDVVVFGKVLGSEVPKPSSIAGELPPGLDEIVLRGLERKPDDRYQTAKEMARAIESCVPLVTAAEIGEWVQTAAADDLATRARMVAAIETSTSVHPGEVSASEERGSDAVFAPATGTDVTITRSEVESSAPRGESKSGSRKSRSTLRTVAALALLGAGALGLVVGAALSRPAHVARSEASTVVVQLPAHAGEPVAPPPRPPPSAEGAGVDASSAPVSAAAPEAASRRPSTLVARPAKRPKPASAKSPSPSSTAAVLDTRE